jgi:hypothetical protein
MWTVQAFLEVEGRFTLSDDSHSLDQVGLNYSRVLKTIHKAGISQLYHYPIGEAGQWAGKQVDIFTPMAVPDVETSPCCRA